MSLTIDDKGGIMRSSVTKHKAYEDRRRHGMWYVTWIPDEGLSRNKAITAMTLAENVADGYHLLDDDHRLMLKVYAEELGFTVDQVVEMIETRRP